MIEKDVNEISRAFITDYWFDDDDDDEKDEVDPLNSDEWEAISQSKLNHFKIFIEKKIYVFVFVNKDDYIPDDISICENSDPLPSNSSPQHSSIMSNSIGYLKNKSSILFDSVVRNFKS
jgi:hypothetical protein